MSLCPLCKDSSTNSPYKPFCSRNCSSTFDNLSEEQKRNVIENIKPTRKVSTAENLGRQMRSMREAEEREKEKNFNIRKRNWEGFGFQRVFIGNDKYRYICPQCNQPSLVMGAGLIQKIGTGGGTVECTKCKYKKTFNQLVEEGGASYNI